MGLLNFIDPLMNLVFSPLFLLHPFFAIAIITLLVSFIITIIYKYTTDQVAMKRLKRKQKEYQKKLNASKDDPDKMMKIQKEMMSVSGDMMRQSFKPMFFTFIPIIIIFAFLANNFAYSPIEPDEEFTTTIVFPKSTEGIVSITVPDEMDLLSERSAEIEKGEASWTLKGPAGDYVLQYEFGQETYNKKVKITEGLEYEPTSKRRWTFIDGLYSRTDEFLPKDASAVEIRIDNPALKVLPFKFIFWDGWLVTYILLSIAFSTILRKVMKVH
jgi:uncharacterized membrane protein (DUF106 family)